MKDLQTAFREIFTSYGAALLESEQLVNYLSDWQIGIDKPTKNVVRAIVNQGYGKKSPIRPEDCAVPYQVGLCHHHPQVAGTDIQR